MSSNSDRYSSAGSDTAPLLFSMTDKRIRHHRNLVYCGGIGKWRFTSQSIDQGPFSLESTQDKTLKRFDADVCATNNVLSRLPKDIYKLINHNIEAKAIWDNVKMLLAGSELTKEDRESQLYDEFERFKMLPGENINEYYVRFHKLVNDMRNIRMTMPNIQLNSKFVNNMSPEWDRFVTAVKLNKGLKETNHEQLYAYLKQHEKHAAQDRLIIERITPPTNDLLAFVSSVQPYSQPLQSQSLQYQSSTTPSQSQNVQSMTYPQFAEPSSLDTGYTQTDEILDTLTKQFALLTQSFRATNPYQQTNKTTSNRFGGTQNRAGNANAGQGKPIKCYNCNGIGHIAWNCTQPKRPQNFDYFKDKMRLISKPREWSSQEEKRYSSLEDECDMLDSDVDDEPTTQSIFMANLSSAGPTNLQASSSDASILSEVPDLENANVASNIDQVEHEIHSEVQQSTVIDSNNDDMGNSNVIPYEQYLTTNNVSVVPSCASSAPNTAYVLIDNNVHTPNEPSVTELAIYKEQVAIYEKRAKFELTKRGLDEWMIRVIELYLDSRRSQTVIQENVNTLQQTFKQRESQLLNDFSNLRKLKDKLENKLHVQDQSIQTVHMMLKPKKLCEQYSEIAIGVQNPFYLRKAKVAQLTLYDGNEIINPDHDPTNVPLSEEDLELAELARQKMHEKMNDPVCVEKRIKYIPHNYSKENFLATFTPQTQLTPKQVFWSIDLEKRKAEELKAKTPPLTVLPPATVEIKRRNLLIMNENLIAECLSKDVFYTATDSVLNVSRFSDMHDAFTIAQKRIADLESANSNLRNKIQNDDHESMIKHFSKLEVEHFNLQLKYQNLKECFGNKKPVTSSG
ncbi:retrovirus-related pol polyprotein from transposon TNT 1-94 [Tanacetum coccineum]